jgi:hypothetical protein
MHVEQLGEIIPPPIHHTVGVCNQVAFLILNYITSRRYPFLKSLMPLYKSLMFWILQLVSSSSIVALRYTFFLFLKCLLTSRLPLFWISTLVRLGSYIHCILACFLWSKKPKHFLLYQGLFCFNSCRPRLSCWGLDILFNVLPSPIYILVIVQVLQSCKPVCNLIILYYSLNSGTLSFLKLNLCLSYLLQTLFLSATN